MACCTAAAGKCDAIQNSAQMHALKQKKSYEETIMIRERIKTNKLDLKVGDWLTFKDNTTRVQIEKFRPHSVYVRVENDAQRDTSPLPLEDVTFKLTGSLHTRASCINLWWFEGQTLRQRYIANMARRSEQMKSNPCVRVYSPPKHAWLRDIRSEGNLFYTETYFRLLRNFFAQPSFTVRDRDLFQRIADVMTTQKLLAIFYASTTAIIRKNLEGREYACIHDPRDEDPKDILCALDQHPKSNPRFRQKLMDWLDYAQHVIAEWQEAKPDPAKAGLEKLKQQFGLSDVEQNILLASLTFYHVLPCADFTNFRNIYGNVHDRERSIKRAVLLGITETEYKQATNNNSKLRRLKFLSADLSPSPNLIPYINGLCDEFPERLQTNKRGSPSPRKAFTPTPPT